MITVVRLALMAVLASLPAQAKSPGQIICYNDICHRVRSIGETELAVGTVHTILASHYDDPAVDPGNPRLETSSGEMFDPSAPNNAASPIWPDGTIVLVRAVETGRAAVVRINNAGPYSGARLIDLSRSLATELGLAERGVGPVDCVVLVAPREDEARYARGRSYAPVPGVLGAYGSIEDAHEGALVAMSPKSETGLIAASLAGPRSTATASLPRVALVLLPKPASAIKASRAQASAAAAGPASSVWANSFHKSADDNGR